MRTPQCPHFKSERGRGILINALFLIALGMTPVAVVAADRDRLADISAIRYEGLQGSQVMDHLTWLSDVYGPRVAGSPAARESGDWAMGRFRQWGFSNIQQEYWPFGIGWTIKKSEIRMVEPQTMSIIGYPVSWTPGTIGPVTAEVVNAVLQSDADLSKWRGKLQGKIVLIQPARVVRMPELPISHRYSDADLKQMEETPVYWQWLTGEQRSGQKLAPTNDSPGWTARMMSFLKQEGAVAIVERGPDETVRSIGGLEMVTQMTERADGGTVFGGGWRSGVDTRETAIPWLHITVEQYNRMVRILKLGVPVRMTLDIEVDWYPESAPPNGFNILADIVGTDRRDEVVFLGAHLDGVHTAAGAVDNAAGVAIVMEAARLIKVLGLKPRRTIRVGLWGGEETAMRGSSAYVRSHFGDPTKPGPYSREARNVSAYFNMDNGSGRIRGLLMRHNLAAESQISKWLDPVRDLGATTLARRAAPTVLTADNRIGGGSDHLQFELFGIPAFEMLQDRLDYFSRTAHSNMDYADRASKPDMVQASVVLAVLAYQAAMADEKLPRRSPGRPIGASVNR